MTPAYLPVFTSSAGQAEVFAAYARVLEQWPVPYQALDIPATFRQFR